MLFNSIEFALFLPIVFILYWFVFNKTNRVQNVLILVASFIFYGWWDWRFLFLLLFTSMVDYYLAQQLEKTEDVRKRKVILLLSIISNLSVLGFFKYYNFFVDSFVDAFTLLGREFSPWSLNIVLPVGISFYTFQALSYTIDVYRKQLKASHDVVEYLAFISFFPQLVAGPIERATNLLPQFSRPRSFNYDLATDGLRQMLWGLFKKVVIADNCAFYVNEIFQDYQTHNGLILVFGAVLFAFQIYCDFSGYSDIAIGTARLFGFDLMRNFAYPYFSRDIAEFWRRWHISLSTWFRDYVYIPLGGSKGGSKRKIRNTFIIFLLSGFWHGANWTFLAWGLLNALYFLPLLLTESNRRNLGIVAEGKGLPSLKEFLQILFTFVLTVFAWVFFRSDSIADALHFISRIFSTKWHFNFDTSILWTLPLIAFLLTMEWRSRQYKHALEPVREKSLKTSWAFYSLLVITIAFFAGGQQQFIYFQF